MVTAKTQYSLKSAKQYFHEHLSVGDYYQEGQKTWGEWFGAGAEKLGLSARVASEDFVALCDNRHPQTGNRLTQRLMSVQWSGDKHAPSRRVFYDFTFSPPKSVSILALVAKDERIIDAHRRALNVALVEFEQFGATRIRRHRSNALRVTQNIVAALFTHDTSRALDPHLHTHCIVFNLSRTCITMNSPKTCGVSVTAFAICTEVISRLKEWPTKFASDSQSGTHRSTMA